MNNILSMSIVTYNNKNEILNLLKPISDFPDLDIYVIDNHSMDGTAECVKNQFPNVRLLLNKENIGFGAAHNQIINSLKSQYHIFVNPDIYIKPNTLDEVIAFMSNHKDIAAMSPKVLNFNGTEQFLPKRSPTIRYMVGGRLERISPLLSAWRDDYTLKNQNVSDCIDIDFCTGCFLVARTNYITQLNGFDERYFLYFEDADLSKRLQDFGRTVYNPQIEVLHEWKRESSKSHKMFMISLKSMIQYFNKWGWKL